MKTKRSLKVKVTPINIRNGATAPYFILEPERKMKRDELEQLAVETFKQRSALSRYDNWQPSLDRL